MWHNRNAYVMLKYNNAPTKPYHITAAIHKTGALLFDLRCDHISQKSPNNITAVDISSINSPATPAFSISSANAPNVRYTGCVFVNNAQTHTDTNVTRRNEAKVEEKKL